MNLQASLSLDGIYCILYSLTDSRIADKIEYKAPETTVFHLQGSSAICYSIVLILHHHVRLDSTETINDAPWQIHFDPIELQYRAFIQQFSYSLQLASKRLTG